MKHERDRRRHAQSLRWLALALCLACVGCHGTDERRRVVARATYDRHCSSCHGLSDAGPAPVPDLLFQPSDLRQLHTRYGTPLDREALAVYIDGRHAKDTSEGRLMPVWGDHLYDHFPDRVEVDEMRVGTIELLIDYLQSIQAEPAASGSR
jgi:hypothetical protein